jgi:ABC-type Fe3+/spermidine/putrescine transport system ATPase subunit
VTARVQAPDAALECRQLGVGYGAREVLRGLDLTVGAGEAVALLGPSGCGKTTLLGAVAGFVSPRAGQVLVGGRLVADARRSLPPEQREVGVVFQGYALWPHLSAVDNVAYPLRRAGHSRFDARRQAMGLLDRMGIGALAGSRPAELSGGEQQRVGVARALARPAALYLFDEPTAHLDTALRAGLQDELASQREAMGAAVLYATHDVAEALAVADRVALLRDGMIAQQGTPEQVYEAPVDLWAARLTGPATVLRLPVSPGPAGSVELAVAGVVTTPRIPSGTQVAAGLASVLVRPEWARLGGPLAGRVTGVRFRGPHTDYRLDTPAGPVEVRETGAPRAAVGTPTGWSLERVCLLPAAAEAVSRPSAPAPSEPAGRSRS